MLNKSLMMNRKNHKFEKIEATGLIKTQTNTRKEEWKDGEEKSCCMDNTFARSPTLFCLFSNINISFCFVFQIKCNFYSILWN